MAQANQAFTSADDFCRDHPAAVKYLERRPENYQDGKGSIVKQFMETLKWEYRTEKTISAKVFDNVLVHELSPATLHPFPIWGELFYGDANKDPELFDSLECFVAFCVARWW